MEEAHRGHERRRGSRPAQLAAQLRDCADGLHAAIALVRSTSASKRGRSWGEAAEIACRCAVDGVLVPAGDRTGERRLGPERDPVLHRRAHERREQAARLRRLEAGVARDLLGHRLERDQEVRRHRRGGVVGGALVVRQLERDHAEPLGDRARRLERLGRRARDRAADPAQVGGRRRRRSAAGGSRRRARRRGRPGGARRASVAPLVCPTRRARAGDGLGRGRDLRVGHAEQDHVAPRAPRRARRALDVVAGLAQRGRQRRAETALSDNSEFHGGEVRSPAAE